MTDNGKNIVSALKLHKRLACACHNLNLVMDDIIEKHPSLEIQTLVECSKKLVQYFKQSGLNSKVVENFETGCQNSLEFHVYYATQHF